MNWRITVSVLAGFCILVACQKSVFGRIADRIDEARIVEFANAQRQKSGAPLLRENATLREIAARRADDMFRFQYFGHDSPSGATMEFLRETLHYAHLISGENLAMGNFKDENEVISGWLGSRGHRDAMLDARYQETGVAAKRGRHRGFETWIIVQIFGTPRSVCPSIDEGLGEAIEVGKEKQKTLQQIFEEKRIAFERSGENYERRLETYQEAEKAWNEYAQLTEELQRMVVRRNVGVRAFNECLESFTK
ncbi:MAG: CAP domain-containing protein [bacterium]|nr:CAP domain-containing protein [bacterium]